jgi:hypothetical protein
MGRCLASGFKHPAGPQLYASRVEPAARPLLPPLRPVLTVTEGSMLREDQPGGITVSGVPRLRSTAGSVDSRSPLSEMRQAQVSPRAHSATRSLKDNKHTREPIDRNLRG